MAATGFLESISPWTSRSTTPKPGQGKEEDDTPQKPSAKNQGLDHTVSHRHRPSLRNYPEDCPAPRIKWFYAVDVPKRKPLSLNQPAPDSKPPPVPKKYVAFSSRDSRSVESTFQKLADQEETAAREGRVKDDHDNSNSPETTSDIGSKQNTSINDSTGTEQGGLVKVPVNEDFLFDVDIEKRELAPTYWLGPIYDVRRGSWFYQEGSSLRPCDENLAVQLEEGYLKAKPWRYEPPPSQRSRSNPRSRPTSMTPGENLHDLGKADRLRSTEKPVLDDIRPASRDDGLNPNSAKFQLQTHRLFGAHMNSVVTYQDDTVAWLVTDDFLSRMSTTVYQRFAGGGHLGGIKVVRGYSEPGKSKDAKTENDGTAEENTTAGRPGGSPASKRRRSGPADTTSGSAADMDQIEEPEPESESRRLVLERELSTLVSSPGAHDPAIQEEESRKRDEDEIQEDYRETDGEDQGREIEHLILVTHGNGQRLGLRYESINFTHDVNVLRKTLKNVYEKSPDLQSMNDEVDRLPKNCRVQVLPVVWRHLLDFPKQSLKQNRREHDLGDADSGDEDEYPSLDDITIEGVPAVRNLITDLALDILLYQSAYREHIAGIVQRECNRIYKLFLQRNPYFHGKVSLIGHSLGSAILFDLLSRQKETNRATGLGRHKKGPRGISDEQTRDLGLDFEVQDFFCLGSPIGLFQMLKGRTIAGRRSPDAILAESSFDRTSMDDPFLGPSTTKSEASKDSSILSITASSPKCEQLFNIFYPTDPFAYRLEPLISPAMSTMKPQLLPYTKRGIFGAPGQGFTGIGARVGQSVSGFWSNITSGVATSLLNRSLGLTGEGQILSSQAVNNPQVQQIRAPVSLGAGTNISGGVISRPDTNEEQKQRSTDIATTALRSGEHPATLIDSEIETLYAGYQKSRKIYQSDEGRDLGESAEWQDAEDRARRLRREEAKVRVLNSNGRVDYSIQEGVFDLTLLASFASHLSYWADEDVSHFVISQLLSRQRIIRR